jgi:hypothetical protein
VMYSPFHRSRLDKSSDSGLDQALQVHTAPYQRFDGVELDTDLVFKRGDLSYAARHGRGSSIRLVYLFVRRNRRLGLCSPRRVLVSSVVPPVRLVFVLSGIRPCKLILHDFRMLP